MKHQISAIRTKPTRGLVTIRERDELDPSSDLFLTNDGAMKRLSAGIGRSAVTCLPDHVGVCEVVDVGPDITHLKKGDVCMIDFYEVKEPYVVDGENLFIAPAESLRCKLDPTTGAIHPMPGYILTMQAPQRMSRAVLGTGEYQLPPSVASSGMFGKMIWSDRLQKEVPCLLVTYEEVVEVGDHLVADMPGYITPAEKRFVEQCVRDGLGPMVGEAQDALADVIEERERGCEPGVKRGDLVVVVTDFMMPITSNGVKLRLGKAGQGIIGVIDDEAVEQDYELRKLRTAPTPSLIVLS